MLRYINTRDQSNVEGVEDILQILSNFKALNAMYVEDIEDGVCGFYATLHTEYCYLFTHVEDVEDTTVLYSVYRVPHPSRGEGYLFEPSALWV